MTSSDSSVIHCTAPDIYPIDAVGRFCLALAHYLDRAGFSTKLYADRFPPKLAGKIRERSDIFQSNGPDDLILVNYSIHDPRLVDILELPNPKICYFHGVTPPELLQEFEPVTAELCRKSITQFPQLAMFDGVMANSVFTSSVLAPYMAGRAIGIAPPVFPSRFKMHGCAAHKGGDDLTLLFVGRIVPHKRIEELFNVLAEVRRVDSSARLIVVGSGTNQTYSQFLRDYAAGLQIPDGKIVLTGMVTDAELARYYLSADAFLCMSLHEGFGIPVVEAMGCGLPVFIREGNATTEVAGDCGIGFRGNDYAAIAQLILRLLSDREGRAEMIRRGRVRHQILLEQNTPAFWKSVCESARHTAASRLP